MNKTIGTDIREMDMYSTHGKLTPMGLNDKSTGHHNADEFNNTTEEPQLSRLINGSKFLKTIDLPKGSKIKEY